MIVKNGFVHSGRETRVRALPGGLKTAIGSQLTRLACCVGLRQESVDFPDLQKVEPLIFVISGLS